MTTPRVDLTVGEAYDVLISAVAVADPDWRAVLSHGPEATALVRSAGGGTLVRDAGRFGRFGWINLCGLLAGTRDAATREHLLDRLQAADPAELHVALAGGRRLQVREHVGADRIRAAVDGDRAAWRDIRRALASPDVLVEITPWLQRTPTRQVREVLLRTVRSWPDLEGAVANRSALARARKVRREQGAAAVIDRVTSGIRYGPAVLERVLLVSCRYADPILIWVDEPDHTVIVHPPVGDAGLSDAASVLATAGEAVGDSTRVQLLRELRGGPRTLADLCTTLDRPRTTLLHHLALLRSAGFVSLTVTAGEPNVYRLDPRGFDTLARAAKGFVLG